MGIKQIQRGMRHRFKYIQLRLRLQVRHLSRHRKARKLALLPCETPLDGLEPALRHVDTDTSDACEHPSRLPYPTLRRRSQDESQQ